MKNETQKPIELPSEVFVYNENLPLWQHINVEKHEKTELEFIKLPKEVKKLYEKETASLPVIHFIVAIKDGEITSGRCIRKTEDGVRSFDIIEL